MRVKRVLEPCLYVNDLEAAEEFYSRVFGLKSFSKGEDRHLFFRCGQGVFLLFNPARTAKPEGPISAPTHGAQRC